MVAKRPKTIQVGVKGNGNLK